MPHPEDWLRTIQRCSLPFEDTARIVERLDEAQRDGQQMPTAKEQYGEYLHRLWSTSPQFFEPREQRSIEAETSFLRDNGAKRSRSTSGTRYHLNQSLEIRVEQFPATGVLLLWIPVPRTIPGVQEVRVTTLLPEALTEYYLPEVGLIRAAPLLLDPHGDSVPKLELCFEVTQLTSELRNLRDTDLVPLDLPFDESVKNWLREKDIDDEIAPPARVDALLDAMEGSFEGTLEGPAQPKELLESRRGNLEALCTFAVEALRQLGLAARLAAGQPLMMSGDESTLRWPDGFGYEHRFVHWAHQPTATAGTFDLSYFQRWGRRATPQNTPEEHTRQALSELGQAYRMMLRGQVYPVDFVVAGVAKASFFVNLRSPRERLWVRGGIDTELRARRLENRS